jgi:hypothetical protein
MEGSLLQSFIAASKLHWWLGQLGALYFMKECKTLFNKVFGAKFRESTIFEDVSMEHQKLLSTPHNLLPLVNTSQVSLHAHIAHAGVTYSRSSTHLGNSLVLYYAAGDVSKPPVAGSIKYIYCRGDEAQH